MRSLFITGLAILSFSVSANSFAEEIAGLYGSQITFLPLRNSKQMEETCMQYNSTRAAYRKLLSATQAMLRLQERALSNGGIPGFAKELAVDPNFGGEEVYGHCPRENGEWCHINQKKKMANFCLSAIEWKIISFSMFGRPFLTIRASFRNAKTLSRFGIIRMRTRRVGSMSLVASDLLQTAGQKL